MELNFDNLRMQTVEYFNDIVDVINQADRDDGNLIIKNVDYLAESMRALRRKIVILTCIEDEKEGIKFLDINIKKLKI